MINKDLNPFLLADGYKTSHANMYPEGTTLVYANFTPRSMKYAPDGVEKIVSMGQQMTIRMIHELFKDNFFDKPKKEVIDEIQLIYSAYLGSEYDVSRIAALHDLGYLPIIVKSLPEGVLIDAKIPLLTIYNTHDEFFWLPNFLETILSTLMWKPVVSASIAYEYRRLLEGWCLKTDPSNLEFVKFQGHDFSMRGMDSVYAAGSSGIGHASCFLGSDTLPVIHTARKFYDENDVCVFSVPATEHSVMSAGGKEDEIETFRRLLKTFPTGILSVVSDTWDLWNVCTNILPQLKDEILARNGKLVIRPDSGDPVDIICGTIMPDNPDYLARKNSPEEKGVIELLWDVFGGTTNNEGYKVLDSHIGCIYGDSITLDRANRICSRLADKGFASTNVVFGIGSFTYQYNTRDTFGMAMKATYCERMTKCKNLEEDGSNMGRPCATCNCQKGVEIFKDPITDNGMKKSAKGLLSVKKEGDKYVLLDQVDWKKEHHSELKPIYHNGDFENQTTLTNIREKINNSLKFGTTFLVLK